MPLHIVLTDDDKDDCLLFIEALQELNLSVELETLHDGEQLMQWLGRKKNKLPDIIFLDLNMPRKNGFECLTEIKSNEKLKSVIVIIISTSYEEDILNLLYKNGAQYYLVKPSDFSELKALISKVLALTMERNSFRPPRDQFVLKNDPRLIPTEIKRRYG